MKNTNSRYVGIMFVIVGASFWGIGGTAADYLFKTAGLNVNWYVSTRLVVSGLLLLGVQTLITGTKNVFIIWKDSQKRVSLILFSLFGMLLVQYSYMASIEAGNAAVATLLQYLAPVYIIVWFILKGQQR
ncbi:MAG TPA: EamA family transporter, partial [Candidatus Avamphibacillus intestinigallinarum]|nr:EamA family transporter [Candidatus Avamphibacillus intestinigallinarum]